MLHHHKQLKLDYLQTKIATDLMHCKFKSSGQKKKGKEKKRKQTSSNNVNAIYKEKTYTKTFKIEHHLACNLKNKL